MDNKFILNEIRKFYGLKRNVDFANFFGISQQNANGWYNRTSLDFEAIYQKCPDINPDWLLSGGEGDIKRPATQTINGNENTQVGRDYIAENSQSVAKALDALKEEQGITKKAQEQADRLISIVESFAAKEKE